MVEDQASALANFRRVSESEPTLPTAGRIEVTRAAFARYARGVAARIEAARIAGDALSPGLPQCRIAAWLSRALRARALRLTPEERRRIDRLHSRLARRFTVAAERALAELVGELPDEFDPSFLASLEDALESHEADRWAPIRLREIALLIVNATTASASRALPNDNTPS